MKTKDQYIPPQIEVIDIEIAQNFFASSGDLYDMDGENW